MRDSRQVRGSAPAEGSLPSDVRQREDARRERVRGSDHGKMRGLRWDAAAPDRAAAQFAVGPRLFLIFLAKPPTDIATSNFLLLL
jgi:hypothetical protein